MDTNFEMENPDADTNLDATEDEAFETAGQFSREFLPFLAASSFSPVCRVLFVNTVDILLPKTFAKTFAHQVDLGVPM